MIYIQKILVTKILESFQLPLDDPMRFSGSENIQKLMKLSTICKQRIM